MDVDDHGTVSNRRRLTHNNVFEGTPVWSPDGAKILFTSATGGGMGQQLFVMNADGTGIPTQLTFPPGLNVLASWGVIRVKAP
jgi:Tol biopolymer transport system component